MRDIKFRAWDKEENEIVLWDEMMSKYSKTALKTFFTSDHLIPMQYTGLKDKNGKDIYEGDICKGFSPSKYNSEKVAFVVEFRNGAFRPRGTSHMKYYKEIEVIGNIHEDK